MAQKVEIEVVATDSASTKLSNIANVVTGMNNAIGLVQTAGRAMNEVLKQTVNIAQDYNQQVRDMMLTTGGTATESSKLIQVIDDLGVSYDTLKTALKMASKEGIDPTTEGLARLADEYNALAPGVERNQFLMDKFGRSGLDMARAMEIGGNALRGMAADLDGALVLTEENVRASEEYRRNLDTLQDAIQAQKVAIGNALIPAINQLVSAHVTLNRQQEYDIELRKEALLLSGMNANQYNHLTDEQQDSYEAQARLNISVAQGNTDMERMVSVNRFATEAIEANTSAMQAQSMTLENYMANAMWLTSNQEQYNQSIRDLNAERNREMETLAEVEKKYGSASAKVEEQKQKIGELDAKIKDLQATQKEQTDQWVLKLMEQSGATVEAQLAYAEAAGLITSSSANTITAIDNVTQQFEDGTITVTQYRDMVAKLIGRIMALDGMQATADVYVNTHGSVPTIKGAKAGIIYKGDADAPVVTTPGADVEVNGMRADGGSVRAGGSYIVGERGMELFTPTTNGYITPNKAMGGMTVNLTYAPMFSTANKAEFLQNVTPLLDDWYRRKVTS